MNMPADIIDAIRDCALLSGLTGDVLAQLLDRADTVTVAAGTSLIRQGEAGDSAFVILTGALDVVVETPLGEVSMTQLGPRQIVGEIAVFTDLPRTATVRATQDTTVLCLSRRVLTEVILAHPDTAFGVIAALGRRIDALNQPLALLTLAAQALERQDLDLAAVGRMLSSAGDESPFARSFQKIVQEMQAKNARRQEMEFAARLQQSILPRTLDFGPHSPFHAAAFMRPARDIGGDFYDFFLTEGGRAIMVVADVAGKGIPAALFMAISRTLLRAVVQSVTPLEEAVSRANAQLEAENEEGLFITLFIAELHVATGVLRYVNAGHCDGYVLGADGHLRVLGPTGPALAMIPAKKFRAEEVRLQPGDVLLVTSDGITEAFAEDESMFGESRVMDLLASLSRPSAAAVLAAVDEAVLAFSAGCEQSDDITCLALSRSA